MFRRGLYTLFVLDKCGEFTLEPSCCDALFRVLHSKLPKLSKFGKFETLKRLSVINTHQDMLLKACDIVLSCGLPMLKELAVEMKN